MAARRESRVTDGGTADYTDRGGFLLTSPILQLSTPLR
jgi:hypothetical protein